MKTVHDGDHFSDSPFKGGKSAAGVLIILLVRLGFQFAAEIAHGVGAEYAQATEQRMRGEGEVRGVAAGDGAADFIEQPGQALLKKCDQPRRERLVAVHLIEEWLEAESRLWCRG